MALIGYARVSTKGQDEALQLDSLNEAGCERIFQERASAAKERPELAKALDYVRAGDTLVVWKLDRLGRSLKHLIEIAADLEERGVDLRFTTQGIDTSTPGGRMVFHMLAALAEFERELIRERTYAGLAAARARGRTGGRKKALTDAQLKQVRQMYGSGEYTVATIAEVVRVSPATIYRALNGAAKVGL
jgi:DNA invertase Pin-like site-specific DNA recombinase